MVNPLVPIMSAPKRVSLLRDIQVATGPVVVVVGEHRPSTAELQRRRDIWHAANLGEQSTPRFGIEGATREGDFAGVATREGNYDASIATPGVRGSSSNQGRLDTTPLGDWPTIDQSLHIGKRGHRRFTMAPGELKDWGVDESGYHPQTKGVNALFMIELGQRIVHDRVAKDIICHLFAGEPDPDMEDLVAACDRLENSMSRTCELESATAMAGCSGNRGDDMVGT